MAAAAQEGERMSYDAYLAFERESATKHEYVNGEVFAMAGGSPEHARLAMRIGHVLTGALRGQRCESFSSDLRVRIERTGRSTHPDATVVCDRIERAKDDPDAVVNPSVIFEVLSDTTESEDRGSKWAHYQRIPSLLHYVLVSQSEPRIEVFTRAPDGWHYALFDAEAVVELARIGVAFPVAELYVSALGR